MLLAILRVCNKKQLESIPEDDDDDTRTIPDASMSPDLAARKQLIKKQDIGRGKDAEGVPDPPVRLVFS